MSSANKIVDYLGRPIDTGSLVKEIATPSISSVRTTWYESIANTLTPETLGSIIVNVDQNEIVDYLTLAEEMEERDLHYRSVLATRKLAVSGLDRVVEAASDDAKDVEIADFVREVINQDAFDILVGDLLDAIGKGFSVSEIIWDRGKQWLPAEFVWRDQRHFQFDQDTGAELRMRDESASLDGLELEPYKFIQHRPRLKTGLTIKAGLARLAVVAYMCKSYALKDWLAFAETFGMPLRVGRYDDTADAAQKTALLNAVARIGIDAACIIPRTMEIDFVEAGQGKSAQNDKIFLSLVEYLDSQVSKGVLGQTMTTDDGSSLSQAQVHDHVRSDIKESDAKQLEATLRRDLVKPLVDLNFPGDHEYPNLRFDIEEPEDLVALSESLPKFIALGLRVEQSVIRDKFGLEEPEEGAEILGVPSAAPEESEEEPAADSEETPVEEEAAEQARIVTKLLNRIQQGEELTAAQERVVELFLAARQNKDSIDYITDQEVNKWRKTITPISNPILKHAQSAKSYADFVAGLDDVIAEMDSEEFLKSLALATFKARGLGDGTDKP